MALGTDGYPAQMKAELAALWEVAKRHGEEPLTTTPRLDNGRQLASERFGLPFGPVAEGVTADLVVEDEEGPLHVLVGGRLVVRDRKLVNGDLETIRAEAQEAANRLWPRMQAL